VRRDDDRLLVAGSRSFYVSAFDPGSGSTRWVTNAGHAVTSLIVTGDCVAVGTEDGRILVLDFEGKVLSETKLNGAITQLAGLGDDVVALGAGEGVWRVSI
jgi:outer membrane protein assembly factor BamB